MTRPSAPTGDGDALPEDDDDSFLRDVAGMDRGGAPAVLMAAGLVVDGAYQIVRELGAGGMGTVYLAHDLRLRRDVAIKVHQRADATGRLRREATAMAQLTHPNVITVYEIGEYEGHPFVAMEYVDGGTARTWHAERRRSWREVVAFYMAAARGLAAAHAVGLVHRDFKPDNVLVGKDGRIRVADFGLALPAGPGEGGERPGTESPVTFTGSAAGTPGYMAPEQYDGGEIGPAADQYAFCVALWEALCGIRPSTTDATTQVGAKGPATPKLVRAPDVPAWLEPVIARGLRIDAAGRWPSMDALIDALAADPIARRKRRLRNAAIGAAMIAPAIALVALVPGGGEDPAAMCGRAKERTAGVWDPPRRQAVARAFTASGRVEAAATFERVAAQLDERTEAWIDARIDVCEATHVRGDQSAQLLDLRMRCLDRRLGEVRALVDVLAIGDAGVVDHAVEATAALRPLDDCADADALGREVPLPDDPAVRTSIAVLEQRLSGVEARTAAGRYTDALPLAERLDADATSVPYPPLRARIAHAHAGVLTELGRHADAERTYFTALELASEAHDDRLALDAWSGVIAVRVDDSRLVGADVLAQGAIAAAARLDADDPGRARLEEALAALRAGEGRYADALVHATVARAWFAANAAGSYDEAGALTVFASALEANGKFDDALAASTAALAIVAPLLGADHPEIARLHMDRSRILTELSRFEEALAELDGLIAPVERAYGADSVHRGRLAFAIGEVDRKMGRYDDAIAAYQQAAAIFHTTDDDVDLARALVGLGSTAVEQGHMERARDVLVEAVAVAEGALPESEQLLSGILIYLGGAMGMVGDLASAQTHLLRALEIRTRLYGPDSLMVAQVENSIGTNFTWLGDHAQATAHLERAIAIFEPALGVDSIDALFAHHNLGTDLADQGRWEEAHAHHSHALAGMERVLGADHPLLCAPLSMLAYEHAELGRGTEGVAAGERCHAIRVARGEPDGGYLQLGLGAAMWVAGIDRPRARALVEAAVKDFRQYPDDPAVLPRAEAWLKNHR